jgi:D-alanyl-D-alanine carboxypeptidase
MLEKKIMMSSSAIKTRILFLVFLLMSGSLLTSCKEESAVGSSNKDHTTAIKAVVESLLDTIKKNNPEYPGGFSIYVTYPGGKAFATAGFANAPTELTHFRAASNTKSFTSTSIMLLYQKGKLNFSAKVTDTIPGTNKPYLPDDANYNIPFKNSITILQLMQHRAGVFDVSNEMIPDSIQANVPYKGANYLDYIMETDPTHTFTFDELTSVNSATGLYYFPPGGGYHYSNSGYVLLGKIIERVSGKGYSDFVKDEILIPMGLLSSSMPYLGSDRQLPAPFVPGYVQSVDGIKNTTISNISGNVAEGNLITTPADLAKFLRESLLGRGVISSVVMNQVILNMIPMGGATANGYGCGLQYVPNLGYGHTGAHEGYLSEMIYDPVTDITMVIYSNAWDLRDGILSISKVMNTMQEALYKTKGIVLGR